jgi:GPH family glycoside/pentoside/hexuronide:cation symporter
MPRKLNLRTKVAYGVGELAGAIPGNILVFFLLFFLTNIAGLSPTLAGSVLLIAKVWDGINDPLIGWLSDHTRSPLGRRYPWMLGGGIPLGVFFALHWFTPNISNQWFLFAYYSLISLLFYAAFTAVLLPLGTLAAELTQDYDQRTSLISFKSAFSIGGSIFSLILAQIIFTQIDDLKQQYLVLGIIGGAIAILAIYLSVWGTYPSYQLAQKERRKVQQTPDLLIIQQFKIAFTNKPFLYIIAIYLCSWLSVQIIAVILPYFVVYWMKLPENNVTQMALAVQGTALFMMFFWSILSKRFSKKTIYCLGIPLTIIAIAGLFFLQPGDIVWMYTLGIIAGIGIATAYLVPWSMLPDVIDLDELNTGQRREGIFYGCLVQIQKIGVAFALFMVGKTLDWSGFITGSSDNIVSNQPESVFWAIRLIIGPLPALVLIIGLVAAYFYPISREVHGEILLKLSQTRQD